MKWKEVRARLPWERTALLLAVSLAASCTMDEEERRGVLETAETDNYAISQDSVVQDMRSPPDSGRLIYDSAVSLSQRPVPAAAGRQVWAPFILARPDTTAAGSNSRTQRPDSAPPINR